MGRHLTSFNREAMCALGRRIADGTARRIEFLHNLKSSVREFLGECEQNRLEIAEEIKAASDAWQSRYCHAARQSRRQSSGK